MDYRWFREQQARFSGEVLFDDPLAKHTYYRIGGPAKVFAFPKSREDLAWLAEGISATGIPYFILGAGSNLLVSDHGFDGLVIRVSRINLEFPWTLDPRIRVAPTRFGCVQEEALRFRLYSGERPRKAGLGLSS